MIEASWAYMLGTAVCTLFFFRIWGWIDGTDRWERREREAQLKAEAEGWAKWASTKGN